MRKDGRVLDDMKRGTAEGIGRLTPEWKILTAGRLRWLCKKGCAARGCWPGKPE